MSIRLLIVAVYLAMSGSFWTSAHAATHAEMGPAHAEPHVHADAHQGVDHDAAGHDHDAHGDEHHALPLYPVVVFHVLGLPVTNSMIITTMVALFLILCTQLAMRSMKAVPDKVEHATGLFVSQNFWEFLVEGLYGFLEGILGKDLIKKTFWFFGTIFIFILFTNWFGLIPGVGTLGHEVTFSDGSHEFRPFLRGGNADLNMTASMALLFFALWTYWALQANGAKGFLAHIFAPKGKTEGFMGLFMILIFFVVGILETISILFRPVSLSFRLFGNIFAGENILESMLNIVPWLGWIIPLPFYFLELLVGLVQALVFTLLTAVFTYLICHHDEEHHSEEEAHH